MITVFESFVELADEMCRGEGTLHAYNCARFSPSGDPCLDWQCGVMTFAGWLDHIGAKVKIPDSTEGFYDFCAKRGAMK